MKCWVVGATGQVGTVLCRHLEEVGHDVVEVSRRPSQFSPTRSWIAWDAQQPVDISDDVDDPEAIFYLAGQTSAYLARGNPAADALVNLVGMLNLLEAVRRRGARPFVVHAGAATEVGLVNELSIGDGLPDRPPTFYEVGKVVQRIYLQQYRAEGWFDSTTLRLSNVYGGVAQAGAGRDRGFLNAAMKAALAGETLNYYAGGNYVRDFIHVDDVARALAASLAHSDRTGGEAFMVGTGVGTRLRDALALIASHAAAYTGRCPQVVEVEAPIDMYEIDRRDAVVDSSRFEQETGWTADVSLSEGVKATLRLLWESR